MGAIPDGTSQARTAARAASAHLHEVAGQEGFLDVQRVLLGAKGRLRVGQLDPLDDFYEFRSDDVGHSERRTVEEVILTPFFNTVWGEKGHRSSEVICWERQSPAGRRWLRVLCPLLGRSCA